MIYIIATILIIPKLILMVEMKVLTGEWFW